MTLLLGAGPLLGCVRRVAQGDTTTYSIERWAIGLVAFAAVSVGVLGWFVARKRKVLGYIMLGAGALVICTTVPGLSMSRATVSPDHVEWNRGFKHYDFRFDDLARIEHSIKRVPIGRTIQEVHYLDFSTKSGENIHVQVEPSSDRFLEDAIPEILGRAEERGVPCVERRPN